MMVVEAFPYYRNTVKLMLVEKQISMDSNCDYNSGIGIDQYESGARFGLGGLNIGGWERIRT